MTRLLLLGALLLPAAHAAGRAADKPDVREVKGRFSCALGRRWVGRDSWSGPYPFYAFVKNGRGGRAATISIEEFGKGNALYPSARHYLRARAGRKGSGHAVRVGTAAVTGRQLDLWERVYAEAPQTLSRRAPPKVRMRELFAVLDQKERFLVLRLAAPEAVHSYGDEFRSFLKSFRVLEKKPVRRGLKEPK